jgi:two-component system, sensor histidine kinase PdtaS
MVCWLDSRQNMPESEIVAALGARKLELRQRLCEQAGDGLEPQPGSDAELLLDSLCGMTRESYRLAYAASARRLAEQGGHLEVRLESIQQWNNVLSDAIRVLLSDQPSLASEAQRFLGMLTADVMVTLTRAFQEVKTQQAAEEAETARRGLTRMEALQRINAAANSMLELDQTLQTAAKAVADEMSADLCVIFLFDDITRELQLRATSGPGPSSGHFSLQLGQGYTGWVAEHGHPLIVRDAFVDARFSYEAVAYGEPYRGLLAVPIIFFTMVKLQGVIAVQTKEPRYFSQQEVHFLEIVAGQLAMNIENGQLYEQTDEELRRKVHELSTLHRVSAAVTSTLDLDNVLSMIVAQAVLLSGADSSILFELDPTTDRLRAVASHGFDTAAISNATVQAGQCCVGRVLHSGEPSMQVDCMRQDVGCFLHGLPDVVGDQHAVLCAPLTTVHGPLGALCVFSSRRHMLNAHQLQLVVTFANVAAIAMENARLFTETREGLRTKEALLREMHHRVKNNLQQVASILNMQRRRAKSAQLEQILEENVSRIQGIAATHDLLSTAELGMAPVDEIARKIVGIVRGNLVPPELHIRFHINRAPFPVPSEQATTLAIVLNELIANAIEHGFGGRDRGEIRISGALQGDAILLRIADDGKGLPTGFSIEKAEGMGLQLVRRLVESELHGSVYIGKLEGNPDLNGAPDDQGVRITDPLLPSVVAEPGDQSEAPGDQCWTMTELCFPVVITESQ